MTPIETTQSSNEAAILERVVEPGLKQLPRGLARRILAMKFPEPDLARIDDLSAKARAGALKEDEDAVLESYLRIGHLLSILKSKARQSLRKPSTRR